MASERQIFKLSGPGHLTDIDWSDADHRRCIAASLVQGVCVQERDRQQSRLGADAHAPLWWTFFRFKLLHPLIDNGSIFGAVYELTKKGAGGRSLPPGAPKIVVAFRGTIVRRDSFRRDFKINGNIVTHGVHTTPSFHTAFEEVKNNVHRHGADNVWIAGHSQGAALAMLVGREMIEKEGCFIEAHLFNPPFVSAPVERIKNEKVKRAFYFVGSLVTAGLAMSIQRKHDRIESHRAFCALRSWVPCLYVNPRDYLCCGYIGYFESQEAMQRKGVGGIANLAAEHSIRDMLFSAFGKDSKAGHLIPSARLTVNLSPAPVLKRAHGIHQWWAPDIRIQCTEFRILPDEASEPNICLV